PGVIGDFRRSARGAHEELLPQGLERFFHECLIAVDAGNRSPRIVQKVLVERLDGAWYPRRARTCKKQIGGMLLGREAALLGSLGKPAHELGGGEREKGPGPSRRRDADVDGALEIEGRPRSSKMGTKDGG